MSAIPRPLVLLQLAWFTLLLPIIPVLTMDWPDTGLFFVTLLIILPGWMLVECILAATLVISGFLTAIHHSAH
jgi:hypothetical protein